MTVKLKVARKPEMRRLQAGLGPCNASAKIASAPMLHSNATPLPQIAGSLAKVNSQPDSLTQCIGSVTNGEEYP